MSLWILIFPDTDLFFENVRVENSIWIGFYAFLYVSVWFRIRDMVESHEEIYKYITWLVRFTIMGTVTSIMEEFGMGIARFLTFFFLIGLFIFTLILIIMILSPKNTDIEQINYLRPWAWSYIILFSMIIFVVIPAAIIDVWKGEYSRYIEVIDIIPKFFLIYYFFKVYKNQEHPEKP